MTKKILDFITTSSERSRKAIAMTAVGLTGIMLFFAWTAGVSARLPLLGSEFDTSSNIAQTQPGEAPIASNATAKSDAETISPAKGLIESFRDLAKLFHGEYPATSAQATNGASSATTDASTTPIDDLFKNVADETAPASESTTSPETTGTPQTELLPPAEELPGL